MVTPETSPLPPPPKNPEPVTVTVVPPATVPTAGDNETTVGAVLATALSDGDMPPTKRPAKTNRAVASAAHLETRGIECWATDVNFHHHFRKTNLFQILW
jgi:hypothetical protein